MKKTALIVTVVVAIVCGIAFGFFYVKKVHAPSHAPSPATPTPEKITYTNASADLITVSLPFPGAVTGKTFSVIGAARGNWFFEASFPVKVLDAHGAVLAQTAARAQGDWMTTDFVPFTADITVPDSYIGPATLVLKKDNPSGLAEHDASISFPFTIEY